MTALSGITLLLLLAMPVVTVAVVALIHWIAPGPPTRDERADKLRQERARTMLYEGMTVDEAQAIVWGWEEMTEEERTALPLERRVEIRKIREDLAAHKKRWGLQ